MLSAQLKAWTVDIVADASASGVSIDNKFGQLWLMGEGLPLDAIKKSAISE